MGFTRATRKQAKLRLALCGPAGSGKTYSALRLAHQLGDRVALIDTEYGSASKYADDANPDGGTFGFDTLPLTSFEPETYIKGIRDAEAAGYDVLVIDSLSHAWEGSGGVLEQVDRAAARSGSKNSFSAWKDVTPRHKALVEALLACKLHLICTMRTKTEYILETDSKGRQVPRKVGLKPIQRDGVEYEFDLVGDIDVENQLVVSKSRCPALSGAVIRQPGKDMADKLRTWLQTGVASVEPPATMAASQAPAVCLDEFLFLDAVNTSGIGMDEYLTWLKVVDKPQPSTDEERGAQAAWLAKPGSVARVKRDITKAVTEGRV